MFACFKIIQNIENYRNYQRRRVQQFAHRVEINRPICDQSINYRSCSVPINGIHFLPQLSIKDIFNFFVTLN